MAVGYAKEMDKRIRESDFARAMYPKNPCSEIPLDIWRPSGDSIRAHHGLPTIESAEIEPGTIKIGDTPLTSWVAEEMYKNKYEVDFDESVWTIEVPGIEKSRIEVFQVDHFLYVQIDEDKSKRLTRDLGDGETVKSTKLDLGILTIVVDRPNKRKLIEIK